MKRVIELTKAEADQVLISYVREREGLPCQSWPDDTVRFSDSFWSWLHRPRYTIKLVVK